MSMYLGDFLEDATVYIPFTTNASDGTRTDFSATLEEADIVVLKNGAAMTLDASTITISTSLGSRVGFHVVSINMANDADFTAGAEYAAVLYPSDETVDSKAPVGVLATWSCENRSLSPAQTAQVNAACDAAIETYGLDHLVAASVAGTDIADNSIIAQLVDNDMGAADWDNYSRQTESLKGIHNVAADTLQDTAELQTDWANGGRLDLILDAILADTGTDGVVVAAGSKTGYALTSGERDSIATAVWASATRTLTSISGLGIALATKLTKYVQLLARKDSAIVTDNATELTEINADGGSGAGGYANGTDSLEAIQADTSATLLHPTRTVIRGTVGTATTPSTTQFTASALSPSGAVADQFKGRIIVWDNDTTTAALRGQATDITASSEDSLPLLTFTALTTAPANGDTFSIV